jgi:hypothetical protein
VRSRPRRHECGGSVWLRAVFSGGDALLRLRAYGARERAPKAHCRIAHLCGETSDEIDDAIDPQRAARIEHR